MMNYYIFPANFNYFNIEKLTTVYQKNKKRLAWKAGKRCQKGDIVYIYYKGLTDGSSRILFRSVVAETDISFEENGNIYSGVYLSQIEPICLKDKIQFSYQSLMKRNIKINQSQRKLYINENTDDAKLVHDLEDNYHLSKENLTDAIGYFNDEILCECCKLLQFSKKNAKNRTFRKTNGFIYYEVHHLLMRNVGRKDEEWAKKHTWYNAEKINLDAEFNTINICPVCHREFHYGDFSYPDTSIKNKKQLIEALLESHSFIKKMCSEWGMTLEEAKEAEKYILDQYHS